MRVLCLSGGGSLGAFQVGAIQRLVELDLEYDMYCGTSVGAISAACLAMYNNLDDGHAKLKDFWLNVESDDIKKHWFPLSFVQGFFNGGLYNSKPMKNLIYKNFDTDKLKYSNKKLAVCAVNLQTQQAEFFTDQSEHIVDGVIASAITPFFLDPIEIDGSLYIDGGIIYNAPVQKAIDDGACVIDVISTGSERSKSMPKTTNLAAIGFEVVGIMAHYVANTNIELAMYKNPDIEINIIRPAKELEGETLDFSTETIQKQMAVGYKETMITMG